MKYVKSAGGAIYESKDLKVGDINGRLVKDEGDCFLVVIPAKESDTIEELCDKFVFETMIGIEIRTSCVESQAYVSRYKKVYPAFIKEAYGANWTDKGLIYVARLNQNGEWELL